MTAPVTLTVAQALVYAQSSSNPIIIQDTNANIAASADALVALGAQIVSLQGDGSTFSQALSAADLLALSFKTYYNGSVELFTTVKDTAANVAANAAVLGSYAVGLTQFNNGLSITLNDTAANTAINSTALQSLASGLAKDTYVAGQNYDYYGNPYNYYRDNNRLTLAISDTAANVAAKAATLQALAAGLAKDTYFSGYFDNNNYDSNNSLSLAINDTAANIIANAVALQTQAAGLANDTSYNGSGFFNFNTFTLTINDNAANIGIDAIALQTLAAELAQDTYNSGWNNNNTLTLTVNDTAANVAINATALQTLAAGLAQDTYGSGQNNNHLTITINDTLSHVLANLNSIVTLPVLLAGIKLTDNGVPTAALTASQYAADAVLLAKISTEYNLTPYNLTITGETAANVATDLQNSYVTSIGVIDNIANVLTNATALAAFGAKLSSLTVSDTVANVLAALDSLAGIASLISGISLTDTGTPTLAITASQFAHDAVLLGKIGTPYGLSLSGEIAANVATDTLNSHVTAIAVLDSTANVQATLDSLQGNAAKISSIVLTNGGKPTLALSSSQLANDNGALGLIYSAYNLTVSGVVVANLASVLANPHVQSVVLSDTASNIAAVLDTLQTDVAKISAIILTDGGTPTLTLSSLQASQDAAILAKITSTFTLSIGGVSVANLATALANSHGQLVAVADSAANIAAALNTLQSDAAKISGITLTDGGTPTLAISALQLTSDSAALALIIGTYNLSVSGVAVSNLTSVLANPHVLSVALSDSASNIAAALNTLQADIANLSGISLTDGGTPTLALAASQFAYDASALGKISTPYSLSISNESAANVATDLQNSHVSAVAVLDSATNVLANATALAALGSKLSALTVIDSASNVLGALDSLQGMAGIISVITLTDSGAPVLSVTASQFAHDAAVLGKISTPYSLGISGATVASVAADTLNSHVTAIAVQDSAANVQAALDSLQGNATKISGITLTDLGKPTLVITGNQFNNDAVVLGKISTAYNLAITAATAANILADSVALITFGSKLPSLTVAISDTAVNIQGALDHLQAFQAFTGQISGISLTDSGTPTLFITAAQFAHDGAVLGMIATPYGLGISGETAANAGADLKNSHVVAVGVLDSVANVLANATALAALGSKLSSLTISDSASNVLAALDSLQGMSGIISGITLTDSGIPVLAMTATQFARDGAVLGKISSSYSMSLSGASAANVAADALNSHVTAIAVLDSAANVQTALDSLQANATKISGITLTDSGTASLAITASQFAHDAAALGKISTAYNLSITGETAANVATDLGNSHVTSLGVVDSAANVLGALATLQGNAAKISGITLIDIGTPALAVTASQFAHDTAVLGKISTPYTLSISGETAANVATDAKNSHVTAIGVQDNVANVLANTAVLATSAAKLSSLVISDTSANVQGALDHLQVFQTASGLISGIVLTDVSPPTLTVTANQFANDGVVLGKISSPYGLSISGATVANVVTDIKNGHVTSMGVADTAANVVVNLDAVLEVNATKLSTITLTDKGTPTLAITALQLNSDAAVLGKIGTPYSLGIRGETVANVATDVKNNHVVAVGVVDSAANVLANLDAVLEVNAAKLSTIALNDTGTPALAITASQFATDAAVLGKINTPYSLSISGVTAANMVADAKNSHVATIGVVDSAANVAATLDTALRPNITKLSTIALTDSGTPALAVTAVQFTTDAAVLGKISTPYSLNIKGETAANVAVDVKNSHVAAVGVVDSAANVVAALDTALLPNVAKIGGISLTDKGTATLNITARQFVNDAAVLGKISTAYYLSITGETVANVLMDVKNSHAAAIGVLDSAANVVANLDTVLAANAAKLSGIALTDTGTPALVITANQFAHDAAVLGKISTPYTLSISGETAANVATDVKNGHVTSIGVVDSAAHVSANLASLESNLGKLSGITLADAALPTLSLTAAQVTSDLGALNAITSPYLLSVKDTVAHINGLDLSGVHDSLIEIMPTSLLATLTENTQVTNLNLSLISLAGDSINEKAYLGTGVEVDIVGSNHAVLHQLFFANNSESQLHLLGIGSTEVHMM